MVLNINLSEKHETALKAQAEARGVSEATFVEQVLEQFLESTARAQPSLAARIRRIWADMPEDERAEYPEGGAYQIDHHVYGMPKASEPELSADEIADKATHGESISEHFTNRFTVVRSL